MVLRFVNHFPPVKTNFESTLGTGTKKFHHSRKSADSTPKSAVEQKNTQKPAGRDSRFEVITE